ncbi:hypothetical protein JXB01_03245 [Candidatus Micrarchaeota archaeon]|nr:hypothetical protein [Candidatus Micrarchaeota archaeon]
MKEITVVAPNKVGSLAKIAESLGGVGVNIEAVSAYEKNNKAVFRFITNDASTALKQISKMPEFTATEEDVILIKLTNRPGELGKLTRKLANRLVNLESVYIVSREKDYTEVAVKPSKEDFEKVKEIIKK